MNIGLSRPVRQLEGFPFSWTGGVAAQETRTAQAALVSCLGVTVSTSFCTCKGLSGTCRPCESSCDLPSSPEEFSCVQGNHFQRAFKDSLKTSCKKHIKKKRKVKTLCRKRPDLFSPGEGETAEQQCSAALIFSRRIFYHGIPFAMQVVPQDESSHV
jgi:hypothetical protein